MLPSVTHDGLGWLPHCGELADPGDLLQTCRNILFGALFPAPQLAYNWLINLSVIRRDAQTHTSLQARTGTMFAVRPNRKQSFEILPVPFLYLCCMG